MTLRKWRRIDLEAIWRREWSGGMRRDVDEIRWQLMRIYSYTDSYRDRGLLHIAHRINQWAGYKDWGPQLRDAILNHPELGPYLGKYVQLVESGSFDQPTESRRALSPPQPKGEPLTDEQRRLVLSHLPLVAKWANYFSPVSQFKKSAGEKGNRKYFKRHRIDEQNMHLREIGERQLEGLIRKYDPTRGTFGAYAEKRIKGAMVNYLQRERIRTARIDFTRVDFWPRDIKPRDNKSVKRHRNSSGGFFEQQYAASNKAGPSRLISVGEAIESALQKLNYKQRAVYRGRVLAHPPVSRAELAQQLHIKDETQISRIEHQAKRKVAQALKSKSVTPE